MEQYAGIVDVSLECAGVCLVDATAAFYARPRWRVSRKH
jgi:hypothetical protein